MFTLTVLGVGSDPRAFDGRRALPVAGGARAQLPVTAESERIHFSRGGRERQRVLPGEQVL